MKFSILFCFGIFTLFLIFCCTEKTGQDIDFSNLHPGKEIASNVELIFSDSAVIQFRIQAPVRESFEEDEKYVEEYPRGLYIEFYDSDKKITSSIKAKYARRVSEEGLMTLKDSVVLTNSNGDKLTTPGITWDKMNKTLKTSKFVQLIKIVSQDTFYGFGFEAKDDFSKFRIIQVTGKRRYQNLAKEFIDEE